MPDQPIVIALCSSSTHTMSKGARSQLILLKGLGVEGDAHMGEKVKHRSRVVKDPNQPNLRQVHLIHSELHQELISKGFRISPGDMGENITTKGIDLLTLPKDTILAIGNEVELQVTGLRNPCLQLDGLAPGLMKAVLDRDKDGNLVRKAGIMTVVMAGGVIRIGDPIVVKLPNPPFVKLDRV